MGELEIEIEPRDAGFDGRRRARRRAPARNAHGALHDPQPSPGRRRPRSLRPPLFAETTFEGVGFGLGFSVVQDNVANRVLSSIGEFGWGGAASTASLIDPTEEITVLFFTQLLPSSTHPIRSQMKQLVYQALVD